MANAQPLVPAVVVVHGALGSAEQLRPLADTLRAQQRYASVTTIELPGHGRTPLDEGVPFMMTSFAMALQAHIHHERLERPIVFGYSMGGYAALLLEHLAPGTVGGIVTLGTMLHWTPDTANKAASRLNATLMKDKVPAFAAMLAERHEQAGGWEQLVDRTATLLRALGDAPPLTDRILTGIHCPVHLLVGDRDDSVTLEETTRAASHLPHARASMLHDTPHPIEKVSLAHVAQEVSDLASLLTSRS
ncbi:alpha/beta fold hydrolase [Gemmatimonas sp.]